MSMILRLDNGAMEALFPPGSEARLDLQKAVIAEFTRKHIRNSLDISVILPVTESVKNAAMAAVDSEAKSCIGSIDWKGYHKTVTLKPEIVSRIELETRKHLSLEVDAIIKRVLEENGPVMTAVEKMIISRLQYAVSDEVQKQVRLKLEAGARAMGVDKT